MVVPNRCDSRKSEGWRRVRGQGGRENTVVCEWPSVYAGPGALRGRVGPDSHAARCHLTDNCATLYSEHPPAANVEVGPDGVTVPGVVDPSDIHVIEPGSPGSPLSPRAEEQRPVQSCCCGLIEDEVSEPVSPF